MTYKDIELELLRHLERQIRGMFSFTGWDDDCDDGAKNYVRDVESMLDVMDNLRKMLTPKCRVSVSADQCAVYPSCACGHSDRQGSSDPTTGSNDG